MPKRKQNTRKKKLFRVVKTKRGWVAEMYVRNTYVISGQPHTTKKEALIQFTKDILWVQSYTKSVLIYVLAALRPFLKRKK